MLQLGPWPYTRVFKEDTPSYILASWMGIKPMPAAQGPGSNHNAMCNPMIGAL
jgi:hypothetical protein